MGVDLAFAVVSGLLDKMVKLTMVARVTDGLPLAEGLDDGRDQKDADFYKQQAKLLFKNLSKGQHEASRMSIETGPYFFHYIIEGRVCYLTMCDHSYPKKLAFQYLEDLKNEFERVNGSQIETAARPYAFIKFDTFIQKTKKLYLDTRTQRNLVKLNDELYEVHQIMTRNVQEVLGVGEKLDQVTEMSTRLTSDTRMYADKAKDLNRQFTIYGQLRLIYGMHKPFGFQALIRKYAPVAIVIGVVLMLFWLKNKIW
uniref:Longin domain-containing protein n=1 Tax=Oryza glumipatula TaxID=40148 RepID=A0A0D9ZE81_9ORYZ